ncbi:hypothetical protein FGE12_04150 [Aggregicoccus sp. 17bor-14]|uniref:hypothetical protein n=1 Tax=Myxococcaceae TaxID=31 RepID=UPI00129D100C|nr:MULTISPECIES: hypothetical protein [Myxococcaceae]MBF5041567.1 hypothetical protein [Simulacricoccus sp. 17bor-14]MRI87352.1 hypothetical protein [Aggregicoccus sp. 17bor-14]
MPANDFLQLLRLLTEARVDFVVVGGTAAVLHGSAMATYDLDVLMPFTEVNCERLLKAISGLQPRLSHTVDKRPLQLSASELSSFRNLYLLTDLGRLDVLGSLPPVEDVTSVLREAEWMDVGGLRVRVLPLDLLIQVKASMGRPKDKLTETELRAIASVRDAAKKA